MSGLLITGITVENFERTGTIDILGFWSRRIARLFPALFLIIIFCSLSRFLRIEDNDELWFERSDLFWALTFLTNVNVVFYRKHDYFAANVKPSITRQMWSLAVEEQYYLVWPILFYLWTRMFVEKNRDRKDLADQGSDDSTGGGQTIEQLLQQPTCAPTPTMRRCLQALAFGELLVIVFSYFSSLWTIADLGMSAAYFSTWSRVGDFACGGLVFIRIRLNPSVYRRYSQRPNLPRMSTRTRAWLELGHFAALALMVVPPMVQLPLDVVLPFYFSVFRIPFSFCLMIFVAAGAMQMSEPLPRWALVSRLQTSKVLTTLGVVSYSLYLIHWPLILFLGDPVNHAKFEAGDAHADGIAGHIEERHAAMVGDAEVVSTLWRQRLVRDWCLFIASTLLACVSFFAIEKPLVVAAAKSKRPLRTIALGVAGALVTAMVVGVCYTGLSDPHRPNDDDDLTALQALVAKPFSETPSPPANALSPPLPLAASPAMLIGAPPHTLEHDDRFTPIWLFVGRERTSPSGLLGILDEHTTPENHAACETRHHDDAFACASNMPMLYSQLQLVVPPDGLILACVSFATLSPCSHGGNWSSGVKWVWVISPVLCGVVAATTHDSYSELRCESLIMIAKIELGAVPAVEDPRRDTYTGREDLDQLYLLRTVLAVDGALPGAVNRESLALLSRHLVVAQERERALFRRGTPAANVTWGSKLRLVVMGESVGQRVGLLIKELLEVSLPCIAQRAGGDGSTAKLRLFDVKNFAMGAEQCVLYFIECSQGLPAGVARLVCGKGRAKARERVLTSMALSRPDLLVVHDSHWAAHELGFGDNDTVRFKAMTRFLQQATKHSVRQVLWMTGSLVGSAGPSIKREWHTLSRYLQQHRCEQGQHQQLEGIRFAVVKWHLLTCPTFDTNHPAVFCPHAAHGFYDILPDGLHPSGPSGHWLVSQLLAAVSAQVARHMSVNDGYSEAMQNPIASCLMEKAPPDNNPQLDSLIDEHWVCFDSAS